MIPSQSVGRSGPLVGQDRHWAVEPPPTPPKCNPRPAGTAWAPSLFQNSVVSAASSLTSMASSSDLTSGNSTSITVVFICQANGQRHGLCPKPNQIQKRHVVGLSGAQSPQARFQERRWAVFGKPSLGGVQLSERLSLPSI